LLLAHGVGTIAPRWRRRSRAIGHSYAVAKPTVLSLVVHDLEDVNEQFETAFSRSGITVS
jgi:hypothetical protein